MFELPKLKYDYNELEPHIDARTMEIHHSKYHAGYTKNFNAALENTDVEGKSAEEIVAKFKELPTEVQTAVRNNGGGYVNHKLFWEVMSPNGGGEPTGELSEAINSEFGSFDEFKEKFSIAAKTRFGSGWAWLCVKSDGSLCVCSTANQDNPMMDIADCPGTPILGLDVWEHAYYLNYQNRRPDYVAAFWNIVNWEEVTRRFSEK